MPTPSRRPNERMLAESSATIIPAVFWRTYKLKNKNYYQKVLYKRSYVNDCQNNFLTYQLHASSGSLLRKNYKPSKNKEY